MLSRIRAKSIAALRRILDVPPHAMPSRLFLNEEITLYVRSDGSDRNSGFGDSPSDAFNSWQFAALAASKMDVGGGRITIQAGDEPGLVDYDINAILFPMVGGGTLRIKGNGSDRTTWSSSKGDTWTLSQLGNTQVIFECGTLNGANTGIKVNYLSTCRIGDDMCFGDFGGAAIWVHDNQALCQILNSHVFFRGGKMKAFLFVQYGHVFVEGCTLTTREETTFDLGFIAMHPKGSAQVIGNKAVGTSKGPKYFLSLMSLLNLETGSTRDQLLGDHAGYCDSSSVLASAAEDDRLIVYPPALAPIF